MVRGDSVLMPWEMPGLDAVEARAHNHESERDHHPSRRRVSRRRAELTGAGALALLFLALAPSQTGASPAERAAQSSSTALGVAGAPATAAVAGDVALAVEPIAAGTHESGETAASPTQPATQPAAEPTPTSPAVAVVDLPAGPLVDATPAATQKAKPAVVPAPQSTATPEPAPQPDDTPKQHKKDLYNGSLVRYQNPDGTACTATATEVMLNFIATRGTPDTGFAWTPSVSYDEQEIILKWERAHDTLDAGAPGSDPHGWRNALNYFGWREYTDPAARHYEDLSYTSFAAAVKAAVVAIATEDQPVGILAWAGGHAQIMTGYEVYGLDPAVSSDFVVQAVYLTDPLASDHMLDTRIAYTDLQSGPTLYRFQAYGWKDSGADDPYTPGKTASYKEWYGKWVIVAPVSVLAAEPAAH
jgi:outer membrane biosynthesis protein TonB